MTEIDMNKLREEMMRRKSKNLINNPTIAFGLSELILGLDNIIGKDDRNLGAYLIFLNGCFILKTSIEKIYITMVDAILEERKYIRNTTEYKKTMLLYNEYLNNIANYLKQFNFDCSFELTQYLDKLIDYGTFSCENNFHYKDYRHSSAYVPELLGARVASGNGICRHISGLTRDILSNLDIVAVNLPARKQQGPHPEILKYLHLNFSNHSVVGIIDKEGKYLFDPTMHFWATSPEQYYQSKKNIDTISQIINTEHPAFYNIYQGKFIAILKNNSEQDLSVFNSNPWKKITSEELKERKEIILQLFNETDYERELFHKQNKDLMTELAYMDSILSPYSDEEKTRWVLHKTK